jgi:hypothetical protein
MANSRDFTGKNRKFTGTKGIVTPKGTTGQRVGEESGELRFNTTTELMEYYDGNQWKPIDAPPTISSISTSDAQGTNNILNADGSTLHTITITGGNFSVGVTVKFIGNTGTEYIPGNITRVSNSSITCKTTASMGTTDDPYDILVTNTSGLAATLEDAFSFNTAPVFVNASGQLSIVYSDGSQTFSGSTLNAGATDAEGNAITHTIISGALPTGLTLASSTGYITGTVTGPPSLGNYPFVVRAATTEGTVERQFSLQVAANPYVAATGGTETNISGYKVHTFTSGGNFVVTNGGTSPTNTVEYMIVAGGAAGGDDCGGGGGAGGYRTGTTTVSAQTYPIVVGGGGASTTGSEGSGRGNDGNPSSAFGVTSTGGGSGGGEGQPPAASGGSGGGGGYNAGSGGSGTPGQGNPGGTGTPGGGGGGGSAAAGTNAPPNAGGPGGAGTLNTIDGNSYYYAGGGGGGGYTVSTAGTGAIGGGGGGVNGHPASNVGAGGGSARNAGAAGVTSHPLSSNGKGGDGGTNTGSGGGGSAESNPGVVSRSGGGGSGIVIIRYPRP